MLGTLASSRRVPGSTAQTNCITASLLAGCGFGLVVDPGTVIVSGEGAGTGDWSGATGGVITGDDDGAGSGDDKGAASGTGAAGAGADGTVVQPVAITVASTSKITIPFIIMLLVQNMPSGR